MANIVERNGSFRITVSCGQSADGKRRRETTTFTPEPGLTPKKRMKAVEEFARKFEEQVINGSTVNGTKTTLTEFSERWLDEYANQKLEAGTVEDYKAELENKILPVLGHLKLAEIRPVTLNSAFVAMTKDGARKDGRSGGYSRATIKKTQDVLSSILRTAVDWEVIEKNPMDKVRLIGERAGDKIEFFTPEQASVLLNYIEQPYKIKTKGHARTDDTGRAYKVGDYERTAEVPEQIRILIYLAIYGGLRKGELLALQWSDVNFNESTLTITKSTSLVNGEQIIKEPKTKNSRRVVSIPNALTARIKELQKSRNEYKTKMGECWQGGDWIFIQDSGKQMSYSTPYSAFHDILVRFNANKKPEDQLPLISFHGLRHTSATLLIAGKQDVKTVSSRLGHAQTSTTMNIYVHALKESDRAAVNAIENVLNSKA